MIDITVDGVAFTAYSVTLKNRTKEDLAKEETGDLAKSSIGLPNKTQDVMQTTQSLSGDNSTKVIFSDPKTSKEVELSLTSENMQKLKDNFSSDDFYLRKDGSVRLNAKAEAFVAGWYGDIAYNRNFLAVNSDPTAKLSDAEYAKTKNEFTGHGLDTFEIGHGSQGASLMLTKSYETVDKSYVAPSEGNGHTIKYNDNYRPQSLDDELNTTLRVDKNMDGEVTLSEAYQASKKNENKSDAQIVVQHTETWDKIKIDINTGEVSSAIGESMNQLVSRIFKNKKDKSKDSTKAQEAMQKLIAADGNENMLSPDEKAAIQGEISVIKQELKQELKDKRLLNVRV